MTLPPPRALHQASRILAAIKCAITVGRKCAFNLLLLDHADQCVIQNPGVIDQHIQLTGLGKQSLESLFDRLRLSHIEAKWQTGHSKVGMQSLCYPSNLDIITAI